MAVFAVTRCRIYIHKPVVVFPEGVLLPQTSVLLRLPNNIVLVPEKAVEKFTCLIVEERIMNIQRLETRESGGINIHLTIKPLMMQFVDGVHDGPEGRQSFVHSTCV